MGVRRRENVRGVGLGLGYKVVDEGKGVKSVYEEMGVWGVVIVSLSPSVPASSTAKLK